MAIVQISRIQHRRGRKTGTGMPQLASGEIGWAIDTQELYIGNGAVSEGAPAVGNTEILTEHSDIFALANQYAYRPTNSLWGSTALVERSLQERLDDFVAVSSFGTVADGITDDTVAIQAALDNLYLRGDETTRVTLYFPPGVYKITGTIYIPPYATLVGAGKDKSIIKGNVAYPNSLITTINGSSTPTSRNPSATTSIYAAGGNQARYIDIRDITFEQQAFSTCFDAKDVANSTMQRVKFKGPWILTSGTEAESLGLHWNSESTGATCINNKLIDCEFEGHYYGVYSDFDIKNNNISQSQFYTLGFGVAYGVNSNGMAGQLTGPLYNTIENSWFDLINNNGITIPNGRYNTSKGNKFTLTVAYTSDDLSDVSATPYPNTYIIDFGHHTNVSEQDWFERTGLLTPNSGDGDITYYDEVYYPEVNGSTTSYLPFNSQISIGTRTLVIDGFGDPVYDPILKFPLVSDGTLFVDYVYIETGNDLVRRGTFEILVNSQRESEGNTFVVQFQDTYQSSVGNGQDASLAEELVFDAIADDFNGDGDVDTIVVRCYNNINVTSDTFTYSIRIKT